MAGPLTPAAIKAKNELSSDRGWILMAEFEVPTTPPTRYRLANWSEVVPFRADSAGVALVYSPFPFDYKPPRRDTEGSIEDAVLSLANVSLEIMANLELYDGLEGQPCKVMVVHEDDLTAGVATIEEDYEIKDVDVDENQTSARLGHVNLILRPFPARAAMADHCTVQYKGPLCGYVGTITTCDKGLDTPNGCQVHGDDELAAGLPVLHPARMGAFLSMPRNRR